MQNEVPDRLEYDRLLEKVSRKGDQCFAKLGKDIGELPAQIKPTSFRRFVERPHQRLSQLLQRKKQKLHREHSDNGRTVHLREEHECIQKIRRNLFLSLRLTLVVLPQSPNLGEQNSEKPQHVPVHARDQQPRETGKSVHC